MENPYEILWTDFALEELEDTVKYLEKEFSEKEVNQLGEEIERILMIISHQPNIFPLSNKSNVRKAVILKFNSVFYRVTKNEIQILSFFSNRQSPEQIKI